MIWHYAKCLREDVVRAELGEMMRGRLVWSVLVEPAFGCAIATVRRGT